MNPHIKPHSDPAKLSVIKLSVNLNKIALLRNARGERLPDIEEAATVIIGAGADGLTLHPRPDRRHATFEDVLTLSALTQKHHIEFNIEGNPLAKPRVGYPGLLEIVRAARPTQVTLVPDTEEQITSDHGWNLKKTSPELKDIIAALKETSTPDQPLRISLFMDAYNNDSHDNKDSHEIESYAHLDAEHPFAIAKAWGAERIELYTKEYVAAYPTARRKAVLSQYIVASQTAVKAGLAVNAGHDLNLTNLHTLASTLHGLREVSIGHALINDALYLGLDKTVRAYKKALERPS